MEESITYPSWDNVGVPKSMVGWLSTMRNHSTIDYLVLNRVMRFRVKAQHDFECKNCGYVKRLYRSFEDYSSCMNCGSNLICSISSWCMGKDKMQPYSLQEDLLPQILQQMSRVYGFYFKTYPPDDFLQFQWSLDHSCIDIPNQDSAWDSYQGNKLSVPSAAPKCFAQFCCGEKVSEFTQTLAVCKAAILCPFLWDDCYDWKHLISQDKAKETHISPILNMFARLNDKKIKRRKTPLPRGEFYALNHLDDVGIEDE